MSAGQVLAMTDTRKRFRIYLSDRAIPVMAALAVMGLWLAVRRGGPAVFGLLALGWVLYVVEEYLVHRFIFHARPPQNQFWFDVLYRMHYGHHDQVANKHLLFTPLWFALPLTMIDCATLSLIFPWKKS